MSSLSQAAIRQENLSASEVERLEQLLDEIKEASGSMEPEIYYSEALVIDTNYGGQTIPLDAFTAAELKKVNRLLNEGTDESLAKVGEVIKPYMEGTRLFDAQVAKGWIAQLTMPGYMDQTEPSLYPTLAEAIEALHQMYAD